MIVRQNIIISILLFTNSLVIPAFSQINIEQEDQHIRQLNNQMEEYFRKGNLDKIAALYLPEAYLISPERTVTGKENINNYWMNIKNPVKWELEVIAVSQDENEIYSNEYYEALERKPPGWRNRGIELDDDRQYIYQLGRSSLTTKDDAGKQHTSVVDFILIWQVQEDGSYKIILDTYTW